MNDQGWDVLVRSYADVSRVYSLRSATGEYGIMPGFDPIRTAGFGAELSAHDGNARRRTFIAIYAHGDTLWLQIDGQAFDLRDPAIRLRLKYPIPFVRQFSVLRGGSSVTQITTRARLLEFREWPLSGNFLSFVCDTAGTEEQVLRSMLRWEAARAGLDLTTEKVQGVIEDRFRVLAARRDHARE